AARGLAAGAGGGAPDLRGPGRRQGSIPHDAGPADPSPPRSPPFPPARARQRSRLCRHTSLAHGPSPDLAKQTAIRSFMPVRTPDLHATATRPPVSAQLLQHPPRPPTPITFPAPPPA